jgi:hypothetical protein
MARRPYVNPLTEPFRHGPAPRNHDYDPYLRPRYTIHELAEKLDLPSWDRLSERFDPESVEEAFHSWHQAVLTAAESVFENHGLQLEPLGEYQYQVIPERSWDDAALRILSIDDGLGRGGYRSLPDYLRHTRSTARETALWHLHWMKGPEARRIYEKSWR